MKAKMGMRFLLACALCALMTMQTGGQMGGTQPAGAPASPDLATLRGLAQVTTLAKTPEGKAALAGNYRVTGGIQLGTIHQHTLLPFPEQQQLALRDAFTTNGNLAELADGLGTTLGAAYIARAHYLDAKKFTSISPAVADVIGYATAITGSDSQAGKFFFANGTTDGKTSVSDAELAILKDVGGETDIFGKSYGLPAGSPGADPYGDSRPFQTEPSLLPIAGPDYLNVATDNTGYTRGPQQNLVESPSYPSGHTTWGYTGAVLLAVLVPERYQEMIARGAEYGNDRIIVGAHYAMDVLGGRTLALYDMAHLLANDPAYMGRKLRKAAVIGDFQAALKAARADVTKVLEAGCGETLKECAGEDIGRYNKLAADEAFYADTQTYGLAVVHANTANSVEDVAKIAPEAGYLLTAAFPGLTLAQADQILTETEGPGGGFLDDGSRFGVYSRLNLYAAGGKAAALAGAPR